MTPPGPLTLLLTQRSFNDNGPVALMYHSVCAGAKSPSWPWAVSMDRFREHLDWLAEEGYATVTVSDLASSGQHRPARTAAITFDDGYADNLAACEELQRRGMRASWFVVTGSIGRCPAWPDDGRPAGRLLDANELRSMQCVGMEIGSHTVHHQKLTELGAPELAQELAASRTTLEDLLGAPVTSLAYPYGSWNEACELAAREAGYLAACTTQTGWAVRDHNPYRIRRLTVFNTDGMGRFARKLALASHDVGWPQIACYWGRRLGARLGRSA